VVCNLFDVSRTPTSLSISPPGFIDPKDETASTKTLCAELLRGNGAILLDRQGRRFVNELGTRDHISGQMMAQDPQALDFVILLTAEQAALADKHVPMYSNKKLLNHFDTLDELVAWMRERGDVTREALRATLTDYVAAAAAGGADAYRKVFFHHAEGFAGDGPWVVGRVTPVVHYSMGGLSVDDGGRVLTAEGKAVDGWWAAGEVMGGLHGKNRLGGNALTEYVSRLSTRPSCCGSRQSWTLITCLI
jgi:succinate dehydrogenase/fumarate reductase flavoprotein subunit